MKNRIVMVLLSTATFIIISACSGKKALVKDTDSSVNTNTEETTKDDLIDNSANYDTTEELQLDNSSSSDWTNIFGYLDEEQQISLERYLPVLEGNETFFCFDWLDEEISFQEYAESVECIENLNITEIAVLDIDGHDGQELIIHTSDGGGNYLILSEIEDKFYGVNYGERLFMDLQTDGKFYGSGGAGDRYFYKLNITVDGVDNNCFAELHGDILTVDGETITDYEDWLSENYSNPVGWITFE